MLLAGPALGAVAAFWRGASAASGLGHVGFHRGETPDQVYVLGGNQGDAVTIVPFAKQAPRFGLVGYWWPTGVEAGVTAGCRGGEHVGNNSVVRLNAGPRSAAKAPAQRLPVASR